jgi:hypothetical protein
MWKAVPVELPISQAEFADLFTDPGFEYRGFSTYSGSDFRRTEHSSFPANQTIIAAKQCK